MEATFLRPIKNAFFKKHGSQFSQPVGCSKGELQQVQRTMGRQLPGAYRELLLWMGRDKQGFLKGSDWFLSDLSLNNASLKDYLAENDLSLEEISEPFCFFMHQGYMAAWFDLTSSEEDPECFFFSEASDVHTVEGPVRFTAFLQKELGL